MKVLSPQWPAPAQVRAAVTLREGGVSRPPYESLNLAAHVGDRAEDVAENRLRLRRALSLPGEPHWLDQVHGAQVLRLADDLPMHSPAPGSAPAPAPAADAAVTEAAGVICAVLTADCLPVLFATTDGRKVGVAHAGWRGLSGGVLEATAAALQAPPREIVAWLGPAISQPYFEVGNEVRDAFMAVDPAAAIAFTANSQGRWQADLYRLARQHLNRVGVDAIYGGDRCTFSEPDEFFSYRRDGRCGRMAALIWLS